MPTSSLNEIFLHVHNPAAWGREFRASLLQHTCLEDSSDPEDLD